MEKWPKRASTRFTNCPSNCPTCPLARSTVSFSRVTAYTKVSEASVTVCSRGCGRGCHSEVQGAAHRLGRCGFLASGTLLQSREV
eukprot:4533245-Pleurochrysis_carterae.AAC.1